VREKASYRSGGKSGREGSAINRGSEGLGGKVVSFVEERKGRWDRIIIVAHKRGRAEKSESATKEREDEGEGDSGYRCSKVGSQQRETGEGRRTEIKRV